jgi:hypothetical protein
LNFAQRQVTAPKFHSIVRYAHRESRHPDTRLPSGLPENEEDGRLGEALRVTLAVVDVADNVRGELSAHVITISELNRKKIARPIESVGHDAQSAGIIDMLDAVCTGRGFDPARPPDFPAWILASGGLLAWWRRRQRTSSAKQKPLGFGSLPAGPVAS